MSDFKNITTRNELADFLGIPKSTLTYLLYIKHVDNLYTSFEIPKKNGGVRQINAPTDALKGIQVKLADTLWAHQTDIWKAKNIKPNISHAFEKEKSILTNARIYRNKRFVLNIDFENFLIAFISGHVRGYFEKNNDFNCLLKLL